MRFQDGINKCRSRSHISRLAAVGKEVAWKGKMVVKISAKKTEGVATAEISNERIPKWNWPLPCPHLNE